MSPRSTARESTWESTLVEELLTALATEWEAAAAEWVSALLSLVVWIVAGVEAGLEFRGGENLVCLVDGSHLLFGFLLGDVSCLVGVELEGEFAVGLLDVFFRGVAVDAEDLVVVFLFGAAEEVLGFAELLADGGVVLVLFLGFLEDLDGFFEFVFFDETDAFVDESGDGVGVEEEGFFAVLVGFLDGFGFGVGGTGFFDELAEEVLRGLVVHVVVLLEVLNVFLDVGDESGVLLVACQKLCGRVELAGFKVGVNLLDDFAVVLDATEDLLAGLGFGVGV